MPGGTQYGASAALAPLSASVLTIAHTVLRSVVAVDAERVELLPAVAVGQRDRDVDGQPTTAPRPRPCTRPKRERRVRMARIRQRTSRNTGYSFAAVPRPISTPAATGRRAPTPTSAAS